MPRPINPASTLGKLRVVCKITAAQLAKRAGIGLSTIQKIEAGRLMLTEAMAFKIGWATLVHPGWIMAGNADAPVQWIGLAPGDYNPTNAAAVFARLNTPSGLTDADKETAAEAGQTVLNAFGVLLNRAIQDGKIWRVVVDLEMEFRDILSRYYPDDLARYYPPKQAAEKARARAR